MSRACYADSLVSRLQRFHEQRNGTHSGLRVLLDRSLTTESLPPRLSRHPIASEASESILNQLSLCSPAFAISSRRRGKWPPFPTFALAIRRFSLSRKLYSR